MANIELLAVVNALAEDTSPDSAADFVVTKDTSASLLKRVKPDNLVGTVLVSLKTKFVPASSSAAASLLFHEDTDNGTNKITLIGVATLGADRTLTLPDETGTIATQEYVAAQGGGVTGVTGDGTDITVSPAAGGSLIVQQAATPTDDSFKVLSSGAAYLIGITKDGYIRGDTTNQIFYMVSGAGNRWQYNDDNRIDVAGSQIVFRAGSASEIAGRFTYTNTATQTQLEIWDVDNGAVERVTVGAADSGGSGFKVLRIPN